MSRKQPAKQQPRDRSRLTIVLCVAAVVIVALVAASQLSSRAATTSPPASSPKPSGALSGIPQNGIALGSPNAPVTLVVYADPQCPYCAEWERNALSPLIARYVRSGKLRIEYRGIAILGPDSVKALRYFQAAALQNHMWDVLTASYAAQGAENSGWITPAFYRSIAGRVSGLDVSRMFSDANSAGVTKSLSDIADEAGRDGVRGTPTFLVGPTGGTLKAVGVDALTAQALEPAIDQALAAGS